MYRSTDEGLLTIYTGEPQETQTYLRGEGNATLDPTPLHSISLITRPICLRFYVKIWSAYPGHWLIEMSYFTKQIYRIV